jgi:hypothetical protein
MNPRVAGMRPGATESLYLFFVRSKISAGAPTRCTRFGVIGLPF